MRYLSANAIPQHANLGEEPVVQYQITGTPKPLANPTGMPRSVGKPTLVVA